MSVISDRDTVSAAPEATVSSTSQTHEQRPAYVLPGLPMSIVTWAVVGTSIGLLFAGNSGLLVGGVFTVQPNEARVLTLLGRYNGSVTKAGLWWCNPFARRKKVSLRVRNFQSERIKVNDASGNPIEIAAVVVWRVTDTARAVFDVEDFQQFVTVQSETALRHLANQYPYDDYRQDAISLRAQGDEVRDSLQRELQTRL